MLYVNYISTKLEEKKGVYTGKSKVKNKNDKYHFMPARMAKKGIDECEASARPLGLVIKRSPLNNRRNLW